MIPQTAALRARNRFETYSIGLLLLQSDNIGRAMFCGPMCVQVLETLLGLRRFQEVVRMIKLGVLGRVLQHVM